MVKSLLDIALEASPRFKGEGGGQSLPDLTSFGCSNVLCQFISFYWFGGIINKNKQRLYYINIVGYDAWQTETFD